MQLRRLAHREVHDPLIVVPLVCAILAVAWIQYSRGGESISQASPGANLLPAVETVGSGTTDGWQVDHSLRASVALRTVEGHVSDHALQVDVTRYESGDVTLTSPRVPVLADQTYLFKAYSSSRTPFTLLARHFLRDGTDELVRVLDYPARGDTWSTVSDAFASGKTTIAVQYVFRLVAQGTLRVDGAYLEGADDAYVAPAPPRTPNLIPNPTLAPGDADRPAQWSPYRSGSSTVDFRYVQGPTGNYLQTRIGDYRSGEAKWQYPPRPVDPYEYYAFTATYRSDREVDVVAEFEKAGGGRLFANLATVPAAGDWTEITEHVQVPQGARTLMLTLVSHGTGTTAVRDYSLVDVSKPGPLRWDRPLVSITFDDGWQSAYEEAVPLMQERGFAGTFYVNPATIETAQFMTAGELTALRRAGHEIGAHGYEDADLTAVSADRIDYQIRKGLDELADAGLATDTLATPLGRTDAQVDWYARQYVETVRGMHSGINTRQNLDPYDLRVFYVDDQTTPDVLAEALAETHRAHGWLILVYHQIAGVQSDGSDRSTITRSALAAQLDVIRDSGIAVEPVARAYAEINAS
jgi:peptidoglycan/xylan/chitin deacetylase (PgdA/CDA1 family)